MIPYNIKLKKPQLLELLVSICLWETDDQTHHDDWLKTRRHCFKIPSESFI